MKKNDEELLIACCDTLAGGGTLSLSEVARRNGVTRVSLWSWMNDPALIISEYMGQADISFKRAMKLARKCGIAMTISDTFENRISVGGHWEKVWFQGKPTWVEMEACVGIDDPEVREMLGYPRDGLLRDPNGNRVQHSRFVPAPAQLIEKFIESNEPKLYGQKSQVTVDSKINLGVTVIGQRAAPLPVEVVTREITETVVREALEVLPAEPEEVLEQFEPEAEYNQQPEAQGNEPEPEAQAEPEPLEPVDGLTMEELALLQRARSPRPDIAAMATQALEKLRQNAQGRSLDNIGPGRKPGSGGWRVA
jgi:hypothetical protein